MKKAIASLAALILIAATGTVRAQESAPPTEPSSQGAPVEVKLDPGVARVSFVQGEVSTQRGDNGEWVAVTVNTPISADDRVSTGDASRAELQLDAMNVLRMSDRSTTRIANITRNQIQVQVGQGLVTYSVLRGSEAAVEIDTPNSSIRPQAGDGEYRVVVVSDSETRVIVRRGSVEISTPAGSTHVERGQMITISGTDNPQYQATRAPDRDEWDSWNAERNHRIQGAESWGKTDRYYTGTEDLDGHGVWTEVPDYGPVWRPSVDPGWAPYRAGRWVWNPYYGWTWVSYEPWGWAPYHYGRWFVYGGNWVWWPGPVVGYPGYYPIWAPAYVSFFGWGHGWGVGFGFGFGFGTVGWLAIGPGDWFSPWWGHWGGVGHEWGFHEWGYEGFWHEGFRPLGEGRGHQFSTLREAESNSRIRNGMSSMAGNQFGRAAVPAHQSGISAASLHSASMLTGKSPMTPGRGSFGATDRAPGASSIRNSTSRSQHFYSGSQGSSRTNTAGNLNRGAGSTNSGARSAESSRGTTNSGTPSRGATNSRPSSTPSTHAGNSGAGGGSASSGSGNWRHYSPPTSGQTRGGTSAPSLNQHSTTQPSPSTRNPYGGSGGSTYGQSPNGRTPSGQSPYGRSPSGQSPNGSRGGSQYGYSRPPLNMNRPIVTPRGTYNPGYHGRAGGPYGRSTPSTPSTGGSRGSGGSGSSGGGSRGGSTSHGGGGGTRSGRR